MDIRKRQLFIFLLTLIGMVSLLSGCTKDNSSDEIITLVKGRLDSIYLGETNEEYLELANITRDQVEDNYNSNIKREAIYFAYYTGIIQQQSEELYDALPDTAKAKLQEMYQDIYAKAQYDVRDPEEEDDGSYTVEIVANPVGYLDTALGRLESGDYEPYKEFVAKYNTVPGSEETFAEDLTDVMVDLVKDTMSSAETREEKAFILTINHDEDGNYVIDPDDWTQIDKFIIIY